MMSNDAAVMVGSVVVDVDVMVMIVIVEDCCSVVVTSWSSEAELTYCEFESKAVDSVWWSGSVEYKASCVTIYGSGECNPN